ncbi:hypothetical protein ACFSGI_20610 [Paenibacillus nicotianae]|uniref:Uncharacterized protein n=1 Tax=Paenibacillus nicotianae TaxID=1526551 RepID=A0ABW4UZJ6_9BACL
MKKVMRRILWGLSIIIFIGIIMCFYMGYFMYAYGLIFLVISILFGIGQIAQVNNSVWMHQNGYDRHIREQIERQQRNREE